MKNKLKSFFLVLFAVLFLALFLGVAQFVLVREVSKNEIYIPSESQFAVKIQGKELLKSSMHDLFLDKPDAEIFALLRNLSKKEGSNQKVKESGIELLADVLIFNYKTDKGEFFGFIFQLSNSSSFQQNVLDQATENAGGVCNSETGILLLFKPSLKNQTISKEEIQKVALQILNNPTKSSYFSPNKLEKNSFIFLENKGFSTLFPKLGKGDLSLNIQDSILKIDGKFSTIQSQTKSNWSLKPKGFHLSSSIINAEIQDTIQYFFQKQGFNLPKTKAISINYNGIQMGNGGIIPKMDLLLEFDSIVSKESLVQPQSWRKLGLTISQNSDQEYTLNNGSTQFVLTILNDQTIFIGSDKASLQSKPNDRLFYMTGDARYLTAIEGGGLVAMSLNLYPPFKTGKDFLESLKKSDLEIVSKGNSTLIRGEILFKGNRSVTVETLRLILRINEF